MPEFTDYVRKPFKIEAVQITDDNMDELCELVGKEVQSKGNTRYIVLNKRIIPNGFRAYVGWWVTQMGDQLRCYPNRIFHDQFTAMNEEWQDWFKDDIPHQESEPESNDDSIPVAVSEGNGEE